MNALATRRPIAISAPLALQGPLLTAGAVQRAVDRFPALRCYAAAVGDTPLVELPAPRGGGIILAKAEWHNPTGSISDRAAVAMIAAALDPSGRPSAPDGILAYAERGLAVAIATIAARIGLRCHLIVSSGDTSLTGRLIGLRATVDEVDANRGTLAAIEQAAEVARCYPGYAFLYPHRNLANVAAHEEGTGRELAEALVRRGLTCDAFVSSIGTGATLVGTGRALVRSFRDLHVVGVSPRELPYGSVRPPNGLPKHVGAGGLGHGLRQPLVVAAGDLVSAHRTISYPEALDAMARIRDLTGLKVDSSGGANWLIAARTATELGRGSVVTTVLPSVGTREEWEKIDA